MPQVIQRHRAFIARGLAVVLMLLVALLSVPFSTPNYADDPPPNDDPYLVTDSKDVSGDEVDDAVVADPAEAGAARPGEVRVHSGANGELTVILEGKQDGDKFGKAVSIADNFNADAYRDLVIGAPQEGTGRAYIFLGPFDENCPLILSAHYAHRMLASPDADTFAFGEALNSLPDMDGDAINEVSVRASFTQASGAGAGTTMHRTYVFSGATGALLHTLDGDATFDENQAAGGSMMGGASTCYGDITGADGIPDGVVNVLDLLLVNASWGPCPALPAPCPADIAPQGAADGVVNVLDLLAVIGAWGPCNPCQPQPGTSTIYTSNGTGGGDWFDPDTWIPAGIPAADHHWDVVRILPGDTVTQSQKYDFTLRYYLLDEGGTHVFVGNADIAALVIEPFGNWLRPGDIEPVIVIRNAREAHKPTNAEIVRIYECSTFCMLLENPCGVYAELPSCSELECEEGPIWP